MHAQLLQLSCYSPSKSPFLNLSRDSNLASPLRFPQCRFSPPNGLNSDLGFGVIRSRSSSMDPRSFSVSNGSSWINKTAAAELEDSDLDQFVEVGNKVADAAGVVIRQYFRKNIDIIDKEDLSPVTIADQAAEEAMVKIIQESFPSHAIYGEEDGWRCEEDFADFVWVLDPIDGTKSFITGKPVFGTLIALLYKGKPILGIIDQPVLRERWIGVSERKTTLNGQEVFTRNCPQLSKAYLFEMFSNVRSAFGARFRYTTSPHLFMGDAEAAFSRVSRKVKIPLYGCDCYAYALLASGYVDLVIESGLKPYDFFALIPVIEGAGGVITDWHGHRLSWEPSSKAQASSFNVMAAGDKKIHQEAMDTLQWR